MNYFYQLTTFYSLIETDNRLCPHHVSMYLGLLYSWNKNRFGIPLTIYRDSLMAYSRIGSTHTYYKCINELDNWGFIDYIPAKNGVYSSKVNMYFFDVNRVEIIKNRCSINSISDAQVLHQQRSKNDSSNAQALLQPCSKNDSSTDSSTASLYINSNKHNKQNMKESISQKHSPNEIIEIIDFDIENDSEEKRKKVASKKENSFEIPPQKQDVILFFEIENSTKVEALKFFNHYTSNGWLVGGKSPMQNWQASARKWNSNVKPLRGTTKLNQNKNYNDPL